jgi:hypothetical protein
MPQRWRSRWKLEGLDAISIQEKLSADDLPGVSVSGGRNI